MIEHVPDLLGIRILCVDDHQDSLTLLSKLFSRQGAAVTQSQSGELAIALLERTMFDVIISDLSMPPGMDGYDLAHALRALEKDGDHSTPAIALSGQALEPSSKRRFADFQVYLAKPFDRTRLLDVVKRLAEADGAAVEAGTLALYDADGDVPAPPSGSGSDPLPA